MRLGGGDAKGRTNKSSISVVCYVLKYSGVLRRYSRKPLCSDSSKIGRSPLHGVQRDVNYKRFWEYFRIFDQFQSIFGPHLDTLNSKIGLETQSYSYSTSFKQIGLTSMCLFGEFLGTDIDWNGRKYKNKCKEWDFMHFVGFEICTKEKSVGISFTIRKPQVKYFWIALFNFQYWLRHYNIAVF